MKSVLLSFILFTTYCSADTDTELFLLEAVKVGKKVQEISQGTSLVEKLPLIEALSKEYTVDSVAFDILMQELSVYYSFAGQYKEVLISNDRSSNENASTLDDVTQFEVKGAINQILKKAETHQIVMINEAHDRSQHRVLTYQLLDELWKQGFRYIAAESLNNNASEQIKNDYITNNAGYYTKEAIFANLILKAKKMGFEIISYDNYKARKLNTIEERETNAAQSIKEKVFDKDPKAKILIHVGYAHISEDKWLASKLKKITGLETLTVDQTTRMEQSNELYEHPTYTMAAKNSKLKIPFVFVNNEKVWSSNPNKWDVSVFWPRTTYQQGRPSWVALGRSQHNVTPSDCKDKFPCMFEVFKFNHADEVPIDRIIVSSLKDKKSVFLSKGDNIIVITGSDGKQITKTTISG
ncbi:hypothetical protein [Shewanella baltica]|uniref:hypothetical protein n=1 Tax=Shewanella baltica TaxID=62322 RepID=UPI00217E0119|nr:hypothetical protein [Shewanella baltica]MCS6179877.1 hypothetical protein [Shewanella baltica]MCS6256039.1 hypothetical protein [Shewanella baltica]